MAKRIVGGIPAEVGEFPWQVAILFQSTSLQNQGCGGTLVGDRYIVTAAHCTDGMRASDIYVQLGDTSFDTNFDTFAMTLPVKKIIQHPRYDGNTLANDISILQLRTSVSLTEYPNIKPACLPAKRALFPGDAIVSGWGTVGSYMHSNSWLHEVNVTVFADGDCGSMNSHMTSDMLCAGLMAGGKDACQGDSGGPLVAADPDKNYAMSLIGVVSWGFGCAGEDALGIYAEVSHFTSWLKKQMRDLETCPPPDEPPVAGSTSRPPVTASPAPTPAPSPAPSSSPSSPATTAPPSSGSCGNCVFPFIYGNRQHDSCTTIDGHRPWCSTQVDSSGVHVEGNYEDCVDPSCPGTSYETTQQMTVAPGNEAGSCCKYFPSLIS